MFAGEGDAFRTNRRFHHLADGMPAKRLSTAFDGHDPDRRPDIYGKVGNSGVDRDARRHEGPLRRLRPLRAEQLVSMNDQRAGADDPGGCS
jgi:methylmalonyl-CoA mutase N-terminal domain/subunit